MEKTQFRTESFSKVLNGKTFKDREKNKVMEKSVFKSWVVVVQLVLVRRSQLDGNRWCRIISRKYEIVLYRNRVRCYCNMLIGWQGSRGRLGSRLFSSQLSTFIYVMFSFSLL